MYRFKFSVQAGLVRWLTQLFVLPVLLISGFAATGGTLPPIQTVFIILLENHDWDEVIGNPDAPYLNTLIPQSSYCAQYYNPPGIHPSEPNYLWLEAGTGFGIVDDNDPAYNHQSTTNHLAALLQAANISWRSYQEDISGTAVPLVNVGGYYPKHNPFVFFDDLTGTNNPDDAYGIAHNRPYSELAIDLTNNAVARYNFITPNQCDDMHDPCPPLNDSLRQGDNWLAAEVPKIMNSAAYRNNGALFITWDESDSNDGPIGMMVLSPLARGGGYFNNIYYTHGSTLRTMQEIFGVLPFIRDAANATDLSDLFSQYSITTVTKTPGNPVQLSVSGVIPGKTNAIQSSPDMAGWSDIGTVVCLTNNFTFTGPIVPDTTQVFYRVKQLP